MHRNLKPDNIMISKDEIVKLSDFSLSRIATIPHFPYTPEDPKERERSGERQGDYGTDHLNFSLERKCTHLK